MVNRQSENEQREERKNLFRFVQHLIALQGTDAWKLLFKQIAIATDIAIARYVKKQKPTHCTAIQAGGTLCDSSKIFCSPIEKTSLRQSMRQTILGNGAAPETIQDHLKKETNPTKDT